MALIGNYNVFNKSAGRWLAGSSVAGASNAFCRSNYNKNSDWRKFSLQERSVPSTILRFAAKPDGYGATGWALPTRAGAISARNQSTATATFTGAMAAGRALAGVFAATSSFAATGQLVVSGSGTFTGTASFSGNIIAALAASGAFTGSSSFVGAVTAKGHAVGAFASAASFTATRYATGALAGSFTDVGTLTVANVGAAVWSSLASENNVAGTMGELLNNSGAGANPWTTEVESGLTALDALKIIAAAVGGKVSGGGTTTITIRNAYADDKNRIIATVDTDGNRTAITYDLT